MEEIQHFENAQFGQLRINVNADGEPLFCLADVCKALELNGGARNVKSRLNPKGVVSINTPTNGGIQQLNFINEPNFYKCIFQSRKKEAEVFQDWVCGEVLPSIRKSGAYVAARDGDTEEDIIARGLIAAKAALERKEKRVRELEAQVEENKERLSYLDLIMQSKEHLTATQIGQDYGMSAVAFNRMLASFKVQRKVNNVWVVYAPYITEGYVTSNTIERKHADGKPYFIQHTVWTQKGRAFLYQQLKKKGVLPTIERHS